MLSSLLDFDPERTVNSLISLLSRQGRVVLRIGRLSDAAALPLIERCLEIAESRGVRLCLDAPATTKACLHVYRLLARFDVPQAKAKN